MQGNSDRPQRVDLQNSQICLFFFLTYAHIFIGNDLRAWGVEGFMGRRPSMTQRTYEWISFVYSYIMKKVNKSLWSQPNSFFFTIVATSVWQFRLKSFYMSPMNWKFRKVKVTRFVLLLSFFIYYDINE